MKRSIVGETAPLDARRGLLSLLVIDGGAPPVPLDRTLRVGRDPSCEVQVSDESLSRVHFSVSPGSPPTITDHGSRNGTMVGAVRLEPNAPTPVTPGSVIRAGNAIVLLDVMRGPAKDPSGIDEGALISPVGPMKEVIETATSIARDDITVLLTGETGVGKEVLARFLHARSTRKDGPFVPVHAAALSPSLFESELFGHEKGAFTGATGERVGLFEQADGGTLFFDEIGELPLDMQPKLLRVLEDRRVVRVGGRVARSADVRIVAATNRDLAAEAAKGTFRSDLYFRLSAFPLRIPPLRDRHAELVPLARRLLERASADRERAAPALSSDAERTLLGHAWPGNVRELASVMMRALLLSPAQKKELSGDDISRAIAPGSVAPTIAPMEDDERARIVAALERHAGNQSEAAASLGIARRTLLYKLDKLGIARPRKKRGPRDS